MKYRTIIIVIILLMCSVPSYAQRRIERNVSIGAKAGVTLSQTNFAPSVKQNMLPGMAFGVSARYIEEAHFGVIVELFMEQRGWKENFEDLSFQYQRKFTYLQLPILTHIYFGSDKFKFFVNLGPEISFMIGESRSANFDVNNINNIPNFPISLRHIEQYFLDVNSKFDYGISAGLGVEMNMTKRHSILLEGRFYYGLGNVFSSHKTDYFSASPGMSIMVNLGYMFRIK